MIILFCCIIILMILLALSFVLLPTVKKHWPTALILFIALPLFSIIFYLHEGTGKQYTNWLVDQQQLIAAQKLRSELGGPAQIITALKQRLQQNPNSAEGWYLLGKLYLSQQQFNLATDALAKAYALQPKNPDVLFQYAESLYLTQHSLTGKPEQLLKELLILQPHNDLAINLLAVAAFAKGDYQNAIANWEKILPHYSPDSPDGKAILAAIAKAQIAAAKK